jgi:hypothetical protein
MRSTAIQTASYRLPLADLLAHLPSRTWILRGESLQNAKPWGWSLATTEFCAAVQHMHARTQLVNALLLATVASSHADLDELQHVCEDSSILQV